MKEKIKNLVVILTGIGTFIYVFINGFHININDNIKIKINSFDEARNITKKD